MRKILLLTGTFCVSLGIGISLKEKSPHHDVVVQETKIDKWDKPEKYLEYHRGIRTKIGEATSAYPAGYKWKELRELRSNQFAQARRAAGRTHANGVQEWTERGPGNVPGRTRALHNVAGDDANNTWLAGSATGGIWRTTDGGATWSERSSEFPAMGISSFGSDDAGTVIYAGTGEFVSSLFSSIGNGIFKSTDGGVTWTQLPSTSTEVTDEFSIVTRLVVDPADPDIIVATTVPHSNSDDETSAIMRSTDGGDTWTKVLEVDGAFEQIIATPGNFNVQYASQNGVGAWKSTDAGLTWELSNYGMSVAGRLELSVSPANPLVVYGTAVGTLAKNDDVSAEADLYRSDDAGETWSLVDVTYQSNAFDFFEGQGFYDNTVLADPFNEDIVYYGGVSLFRSTVSDEATSINNYLLEENGTPFLTLLGFTAMPYANLRLDVGDPEPEIDVEVRFGPGVSQMAHQFLVPENRTSGVAANEYVYNDYVEIPFEVWDVTNNKQLMVSFRDQNRDGTFDLRPQYFSTTPATDFLSDSREYLYINGVDYNATTPDENIAVPGGQEFEMVYNIFPALADNHVWTPDALPASNVLINHLSIQKLSASTVTVADGRDDFGGTNGSNQVDLAAGVHPDHHFMIALIEDDQTYRILEGSDGGVFVSKVSATPGITDGDWTFKGLGYNTSQFYGVDKKPGADVYIGGMQDNGTRFSNQAESASATTAYQYAIGGDGFAVLWHAIDPNKILGSVYYGSIRKSIDGGNSFALSTSGLAALSADNFSFYTKIANSKSLPDRVFTVGAAGVYYSNNFADSWNLTAIEEKWSVGSVLYHDVRVSEANANIVWTGAGMSEESGAELSLHVSIDGGKTFSATNNYTEREMDGYLTRLAVHPTDENTAYAIYSIADHPKILRTTDMGETWEDISGFGVNTSSSNGFPDVAVYCLYVRPDNTDILWAGTEIGIVESLDNGATWALLEDFPNVTVWDMKGVDNQVVIATHGRGIWTATIDAPQAENFAPVVMKSGTSPEEEFIIRFKTTKALDSVYFYFGGVLRSKVVEEIAAGEFDIIFEGITPGTRKLHMMAYSGSSPYQSPEYSVTHFDWLPAEDSYENYLKGAEGLDLKNLEVDDLPDTELGIVRTSHPYADNKEHSIFIRTPIIVGSSNTMFNYRDIAIVDVDNDSVVIEATTNGLDWIEITPSYNASADETWLAALNADESGDASMFVDHSIDFGSLFETGDVVMFRMRMLSNETVNSWGWAIDNIGIQSEPVATEENPLSVKMHVYPNPSPNAVKVQYTLAKASEVSIQAVDITGKVIQFSAIGMQASGTHEHVIRFDNAGQYFITVTSGNKKETKKVVIKR
ncbi:MAG TPA: T9SS type A sorting domain-containing protein [Chryseosolibacter sp.]|nr:T9SS type A sorting domain-containing protein [Chryseosolibacter sp.]